MYGSDFKDCKRNIFQRALLTFGDYLVPINSGITFCTFNENLREKNDNWRKLFDDNDKRLFLKKFLDEININSMQSDLQNIINNYTLNDWKYLFIKYDKIIEYCDKYRIAKWKDSNKIALSRSSADNWRRHAELYSYALFLELENEQLAVNYHDNSDDSAWLSIKWEKEYYYILETENSYLFGFCDGYSNQQGLDDMEQHVKAIIKKNNLEKASLFL